MAFLECPVAKQNHIKHIIVKLRKTRAEQKILNVAREKTHIMSRWTILQVMANFQ